jgi:hypothetical protein
VCLHLHIEHFNAILFHPLPNGEQDGQRAGHEMLEHTL